MPDYMKNYRIVFIDENGAEYTKGKIIGVWYEPRDGDVDEPMAEPIFESLNEIDSMMKALNYYKATAMQKSTGAMPIFVPSRIRLLKRISSDGEKTTQAGPGSFICKSNRFGVVSVRAENGEMLGIKLHEFEPLEWVYNNYKDTIS